MTHNDAEFEAWLKNNDRSDRTIESYLLDLEQFRRWFELERGQQLHAPIVTMVDLREYRQWMQSEGFQPATFNRRLAAIRAWLAWSVDTGQINSNPAIKIRRMEEVIGAPHWLDRKEQAAIERELERGVRSGASPKKRMMAIRWLNCFVLLVNSGLRISEMCDIAPSNMTINDRSGEVRILAGKGNKARTVPLNREAREALHMLRPWLGEIRPRQVERAFLDAGLRCGVRFSPHSLRHTFAHSLIDAGVSLDRVAAILGHENINTTARYTRPGSVDLARAVKKLEN